MSLLNEKRRKAQCLKMLHPGLRSRKPPWFFSYLKRTYTNLKTKEVGNSDRKRDNRKR